MSTTIRSSSQLFIDENLNVAASGTNKKVVGVADGTDTNDAINKGQLDAFLNANNAMVFKGVIDCSSNPNYPAGESGYTYKVSVAGKIGGTSGLNVEVGDTLVCSVDGSVAGTQAAVGANWIILQTNIDGAVTGAASSVDGEIVLFNGVSGKVIKSSVKTIVTTIGADDTTVPTSKAIKDALPNETATTIGALIGGSADATPNDTDFVATSLTAGGILKKITWTNVKTFLTTFFDTKYWKLTATGDVTISGNVTAIGSLKVTTAKVAANAVTNAKLAQVATQTFKGRTTAATGDVEDLTITQAKALLGLTSLNLAQRKYRVTPAGTINGSNVVFTITDLVLSGTEEIFKNGVLLTAITDYSITYAATTTITFVTAPSSESYTDILVVNYSI